MEEESSKDVLQDCILYELLVYAEWIQEPELLLQKYPLVGSQPAAFGLLQYLRRKKTAEPAINRLLLTQLPWLLAVGADGEVVAILQDNVLEIRSTRDEYSSVIGKANVARDLFPTHRQLVWSEDCSLLAVGHSSGSVALYDVMGSNVANIPSTHIQPPADTSAAHALASLLFIPTRTKQPDWSYELLLVDHTGRLCCYMVSLNSVEPSHSFALGSNYRGVSEVSAVSYLASHRLLLVAGPLSSGLQAWRLLNDAPHYRFALPNDEKKELKDQGSWFSWLPSFGAKKQQSVIFKMKVSPNAQLLACLHSCGGISLWQLPSLRLSQFWELSDQPDFDVKNPQLSERRRYNAEDQFHPIDVNWWTDEAVIIARNSGAVSVCSVRNLRNLLGESPEFLSGHPRISQQCRDRGFLGLECETLPPDKRHFDDSLEGSEDEDDDDEEDDADSTLLEQSVSTMQSALYVLTDLERFQPQRKKPKVVHRTYRLLGLKSTTPEDLYMRKIDNEEYGEALALAKAYSLDCDLVYQRQWRNSNVSVATIHDYLSKITKRSWVLRECVERIPDTFSAVRELLQFGLRGTNLETLIAIGEGTDGGHFVSSNEFEDTDEAEVLDEEAEKQRREDHNLDLLSQLISPQLSEDQKRLLSVRQQLLQYLDRLSTYEIILGGRHKAEDDFDAGFYATYRSTPALASVLAFARAGDWQAVRIMFTYHSADVLPYWLSVLENLPEVMNPLDYRALLPECNGDGEVFVWERMALREDDWSEREEFQPVFDCGSSPSAELEVLEPRDMTADVLSAWYSHRAKEIETRSCLVDHALTLVKLARERNIAGLDELLFLLLTLETLLYDVYLEDIRLDALEKLADLDVAKLLMSKTTEATFVSDLKHLLVPFLMRCDKRTPGSYKSLFRLYLLEVSATDLGLPLVMFEHLRDQRASSLAVTLEETMRLALDALATTQRADQLDKAFAIVECLPLRAANTRMQSAEMSLLYDCVDQLEVELKAAAILDRYGIQKPLCHIRDIRGNAEAVSSILVKLARSVAKRMPPATEMEWNQLLNDIMDLQTKAFTCVNLDKCFQIYAATLLSSGSRANIRCAGEILQCRDEECSRNISYRQSVDLVMDAAGEYFDSAGSLTDPAMELAKACLHLITDQNDLVEEKLDLIASLQLLNDFGIMMLPLQVRLCGERMRLVEACVRNKPLAYRSAQRLMQLANKLRVCGKDARQREGRVLVLIAEHALNCNDYVFCSAKCQELVSKSHALGWEVVQQLAKREDFTELRVRADLLAFALLYCAPQDMEALLKTRAEIQALVYHEDIAATLEVASLQMTEEEEFSDALTSPLVAEKEFVPPTSLSDIVGESADAIRQTTYSLLKNVSNKHFWTETFSWAQEEAGETEQPPLSAPSLPEFYLPLPQHRCSRLYSGYSLYSSPDLGPRLRTVQALFRVAMLQGLDNPRVLLKLGECWISDDNCLGLAHLLALNDVSLADEGFCNLPTTEVSMQLAMLFAALHFQASALLTPEQHKLSAVQLMQAAVCKQAEHCCVRMYVKYRDLLDDLLQAEELNSLGCGIDVTRFTHDPDYRHDTIIGLAMTSDHERFELALRLGTRYGVNPALVACSHVATLMLGGDLDTSRLRDPKLVDTLKSDPQVACDRLQHYVYEGLSSVSEMLLYYWLLNELDAGREFNGLTSSEHVAILEQLQAHAIDVDYRQLSESPRDALSVYESVLTADNVAVIAQLLPPSLTLGNLVRVLARKQFYQLAQENTAVREFEAILAKYFNEMSSDDFVGLVKDITFVSKSLDLMTIDSRMKIIKLSQLNCQRRASQGNVSDLEWKEAKETLESWLQHLTTVSSFKMKEEGAEMCRLVRMLDISRGESGPVRQFELAACISSIPLSGLKQLASLLPSRPSVQNVVHELLVSTATDDVPTLMALLSRMQQVLDQREALDNVEAIEDICRNEKVDAEVRTAASRLLHGTKMMFDQTVTLVAQSWPGILLREADVETEESRSVVAQTLLNETHSWRQLEAAFQLLESWPRPTVIASMKDPWCQFIRKLVHFEGAEDTGDVATLLKSTLSQTNITEDCLSEAMRGSCDDTSALLLCLLSEYHTLHLNAADILNKHQQVVPVTDLLLSLLAQRNLVSHLVSTAWYAPLIEHLLQADTADLAAEQLEAAGYTAEAGSLRLLASGTAPALRVFSAAFKN